MMHASIQLYTYTNTNLFCVLVSNKKNVLLWNIILKNLVEFYLNLNCQLWMCRDCYCYSCCGKYLIQFYKLHISYLKNRVTYCYLCSLCLFPVGNLYLTVMYYVHAMLALFMCSDLYKNFRCCWTWTYRTMLVGSVPFITVVLCSM